MEITARAHWRYKPKTQFCLSTPQRWNQSFWKSSAWPEFPKRSVLSDLKHSLTVEQRPRHKWGTSLVLQVFDHQTKLPSYLMMALHENLSNKVTIHVCQFHGNPFNICLDQSHGLSIHRAMARKLCRTKSGCTLRRVNSWNMFIIFWPSLQKSS